MHQEVDSPKPDHADTSTFPYSRAVKTRPLLFKLPSLWYFHYRSLNRQSTWQSPEGGQEKKRTQEERVPGELECLKTRQKRQHFLCLFCSRKPGKTSLLDHRLLHWTTDRRAEPYAGLERRRKFLRIPHLLESPRMGRHWTLLQTFLQWEGKPFLPVSHPGPPSSMHVHSPLVTPHLHPCSLIMLIFQHFVS